jgi:hypothetical protein
MGRWHAGPPGQPENFLEDGIMRTWIDGELLLEETSMFWRRYNNVTIDQFTFSTFFGGSDDTWESAQDQVRSLKAALSSSGKVSFEDARSMRTRLCCCTPAKGFDSLVSDYQVQPVWDMSVGCHSIDCHTRFSNFIFDALVLLLEWKVSVQC